MTRRILHTIVPLSIRKLHWKYLSWKAIIRIMDDGHGHFRSISEGAVVDRNGQPIPWYSYPAIEYLDQLDFSDKKIFEWGCGYSTRYWGKHAAHVSSVEHEREWFEQVRTQVSPQRHNMMLRTSKVEYINAIREPDQNYDVIAIDGIHRSACAEIAPAYLNSGGLLIFDNSDWFPRSCAALRAKGLLQVDMHGLSAMNNFQGSTTFFFDRQFAFGMRDDRQPRFSTFGARYEWDDDPVLGR